jgi:hypothetical protein
VNGSIALGVLRRVCDLLAAAEHEVILQIQRHTVRFVPYRSGVNSVASCLLVDNDAMWAEGMR